MALNESDSFSTDPSIVDDGNILHFLSAKKGNTSELQNAIFEGADVNSMNSEGSTPLHITIDVNNEEAAEILLRDPNCNPNLSDAHGRTPLHIACEKGHSTIISLLLLHPQIDVNRLDNMRRTALHWSCIFNTLLIVKDLVQKGAILQETQSEETPLHWCVKENNIAATQYLLSVFNNVDIKLKNTRGDSLLGMASEEIKTILEEYEQNKPKIKTDNSTKIKTLENKRPKKVQVKLLK